MNKAVGIALFASTIFFVGISQASAHVVVDSNGEIIGELSGYDQHSNGIVLRNINGNYVGIVVQEDGFSTYSSIDIVNPQYTTSDCTGTPYTYSVAIPRITYNIASTNPSGSITLYYPGGPQSVNILSYRYQNSCHTTSYSSIMAPLESISLSFIPPFSIQ